VAMRPRLTGERFGDGATKGDFFGPSQARLGTQSIALKPPLTCKGSNRRSAAAQITCSCPKPCLEPEAKAAGKPYQRTRIR
jgi:hypothetical protein